MNRLIKFILVASFGLIFSFSIQFLPEVTVAQRTSNHFEALALVQTGKQYYDAGKLSDAVKVLWDAEKIYKVKGNILEQAQTLSLISLAYQQLGSISEAEAAINTGLSLLNQVQIQDSEFERVQAQVLNHQGRLQWVMGKNREALESFQSAQSLYKRAKDPEGIIGSQINQAQALQSLGFYRRSYKLLDSVKKELQAQPDSLVKVAGLHNLGNILRQRGDLDSSQEILEKSLAIAKRLNHQRQSFQSESSQDESKILLSLGNAKLVQATRAKNLKNIEQEKKYIQSALLYYQDAAATAILPITKIQAWLNQLSLLLETNQLKSAEYLLLKISQLLKQLPVSRASVYASVNLADNLMKLKDREWVMGNKENKQIHDYHSITPILNNAVSQAKSLNDKRAESYALGTFGKLYEKSAEWTQAKNFTQSALMISRTIMASDMTYQWDWQMGRILQTQDNIPQAINYYTQAFDILKELRGDLVSLSPEVQFSFREKVEPVYRELVNLLLSSTESGTKNLKKAREVIEALQLAELDNFFGDSCAKPEPVNIDNLDSNAAVLYPIILKNRLEVIVKLPGVDNLRHYTNKNVSVNQVDEIVEQLRQSLRRSSTPLNNIKTSSKQLYDWLIRPFEAELEKSIERDKSQIKTLVFVLDGSLQNIPVSVLYDGENYLIKRYAVAVTPGLQLLAPKPLLRKQLNGLVAGATYAPSFKDDRLSPLENVDDELSGVSQQVNRAQKLEDEEFLQQNIQKQIEDAKFNVVHIATHGKFSSNPENTYILDWDKPIKVKDFDTLVRVKDQNVISPVELLVLSACETATGDKRAALGLAGVAIRAGARSTLASLWQVNDASTAQFMIKLYQQFNNLQITKAEALRNVQLAFLKDYPDTDYNRPYYWAPFILVGNWL